MDNAAQRGVRGVCARARAGAAAGGGRGSNASGEGCMQLSYSGVRIQLFTGRNNKLLKDFRCSCMVRCLIQAMDYPTQNFAFVSLVT